jgi:hypothetical protein
MGKTVPDIARLNWSALREQNHVQMVSPYFTAPGQPTRHPQPVTRQPGKSGDTMGKTAPDVARLGWSALREQNHVQMVSPYFTAPALPTRNPESAIPLLRGGELRTGAKCGDTICTWFCPRTADQLSRAISGTVFPMVSPYFTAPGQPFLLQCGVCRVARMGEP